MWCSLSTRISQVASLRCYAGGTGYAPCYQYKSMFFPVKDTFSGDPNVAESYASWKPRDTFSRLADGTSNQLMIGEKHINPADLEQCASYADINANDYSTFPYSGKFPVDCSYVGNQHTSVASVAGLTLSHPWQNSGFRTLREAAIGSLLGHTTSYPIQRSTDPTWPYPYGAGGWSYSYFGSPHTGICNFVLGDGSVQSLANSTPTHILGCLGTCADGNSVSIP